MWESVSDNYKNNAFSEFELTEVEEEYQLVKSLNFRSSQTTRANREGSCRVVF